MSERPEQREHNQGDRQESPDSSDERIPSRRPVPPPPSTRQHNATDTAGAAEKGSKISKVKLGFLYLLIGGLVITAVISVVALLVGSISQSIQSAFTTTLLIVLYSAILLTVVLADTRNQLGRSLLPTTVFVLLICQMITSVLGVWDIIDGDLGVRFTALYFTVMAGAFLVEGVMKLSLRRTLVRSLSIGSAGAVGLLTASLLPWVLAGDRAIFGDLYYRIIAAISIVIVTLIIITAIMNRITVYQRPESRLPRTEQMSGGLIAIVATVGVVTGFFMLYGLVRFIVAASGLA